MTSLNEIFRYYLLYSRVEGNKELWGFVDKMRRGENFKIELRTKEKLLSHLQERERGSLEQFYKDDEEFKKKTSSISKEKWLKIRVNDFLWDKFILIDTIREIPYLNKSNKKELKEKDIIKGREGAKILNTYYPTNISYDYNKLKKKGHFKVKKNCEFPHLFKLLWHLCNYDKEIYNRFMEWLAFALQFPTEKTEVVIIFCGTQGTGKGLFENFVLKPLFENKLLPTEKSRLNNNFNSQLEGKRIIFIEEAEREGTNKRPKGEDLKFLAKLKDLTGENLNIEIKGQDTRLTDNNLLFILTTNKQPLQVEGENRRFFYIEQNQPLIKRQNNKFKGKFDNSFIENLKKNHKKEIMALYYFLAVLEVDKGRVRDKLTTEAETHLIEQHTEAIKLFYDFLEGLADVKVYFNKVDLRNNLIEVREVYNKFVMLKSTEEKVFSYYELSQKEGLIPTSLIHIKFLWWLGDVGHSKEYIGVESFGAKTKKILNSKSNQKSYTNLPNLKVFKFTDLGQVLETKKENLTGINSNKKVDKIKVIGTGILAYLRKCENEAATYDELKKQNREKEQDFNKALKQLYEVENRIFQPKPNLYKLVRA